MPFLSNDRGDFLSNLVDLHYIILILGPGLADWRWSFFRATCGHDHILRGAKKHRSGVSNLLVYVKGDVYRVDVGFGRESGF